MLPRPRQNSRKTPIPPPRLQFCGCHDCAQSICTDPATGLPMKGRLMSSSEIRIHQKSSRNASPSHDSAFAHSNNSTLPSDAVGGSTRSIRPQERKTDRASMKDVSATFSRFETEISISSTFKSYNNIVFSNLPKPGSKPTSSPFELPDCNQPFDLLPSAPENMQLIHYRDQISQSLAFVSESNEKYGSLSTDLRLRAIALQRHFNNELVNIEKSLQSAWKRQRWILMEVGDHYVDMSCVETLSSQICTKVPSLSALYNARISLENEPKVIALYLVVLVLHSLCGLSMEHCKFVLGAMDIITQLSPSHTSDRGSGLQTSKLVTDIRTVQRTLFPENPPESFVCCPKCSYLYPFRRDIDKESLQQSVPERCTNRLHPDSEPCRRKLWNQKNIAGTIRYLPTREFLYHRMKDWVAWMYSRPDIEKVLDEDPTARASGALEDPFDMADIWDASGLRDFKGPDGKNPFYLGPGSEARLIFSLNMDGFNPYTNKEAGKKVSTGGIYMVCLNLPRSIRYREENIFLVAIIPGPHEPSLHEINYLLKPLVDELLEFWDPGFFYSHTTAYPQGRWIRCALVPLVCDLPASRQMCGSAHYTANCFCSYCWQKLADIDNLDYREWDSRTMGSHRKAADAWLNAQTQSKRDAVYAEFGTRWSELLRLPYWDPVQFTVIDAMHAFYLRIISYHCRDIWGMDTTLPDDDVRRKETDPTDKEMKEANIILRTGTLTQLKALRVDVLRELCIGTTTLKSRGRKNQLYNRLIEYREKNGWPAAETSAAKEASLDEEAAYMFNYASKTAMKKLNKEKLLHILKVINATNEHDYTGHSRIELLNVIQEERRRRGIIDTDAKVLFNGAKAQKSTAVLGKETLAEIRLDMARTSLPSWFSPSPKHPGEKKWGKLTASNWRSFALVNLPITLIRLWANEPESSRKRQMLENFLHLVSAVKIATMRRININHISQYQEHIHAYLTSLQILYPKASMTPYQHLSLHFSNFLERFGPTHAWQCFPFERYNHRMQQIPTNQKFGEMEKTMLRKFRLSQLVRSFFSIPNLPSSFRELSECYQRNISTDIPSLADFTTNHDSLPHDLSLQATEEEVTWDDKNLARLSSVAYTLLKNWLCTEQGLGLMVGSDVSPLALFRRHIVRLGQKFTTSNISSNNSHVLFYQSPISQPTSPLLECSQVLAGNIQEIFSHTRTLANGRSKTQTFVIVSPLKRLSAQVVKYDLYRNFPLVANQLYQAEEGDLVLVPMEHVISHSANVPMTLQITCNERKDEGGILDCILAYPLDV